MQHELFYDDFRGAVAYAIKWLGGCAPVGKALWPALTIKQAESKLSDCLNAERVTKLDFEEIAQVLAMAREKGVHCGINQLCHEAGYSDPVIAPTKTPQQELAEQMKRHAAEYARLADEAAALDRGDGGGR